jgi:hypothetical protein
MMRMKTGTSIWLLLLLVGLIAPSLAFAQIEANLDNYTGQNAKGYLMPLKDAFGTTLNDGMFRSGLVPKSGFTLNLEVKSMFVKFGDADKTFTARTEKGFFPEMEVPDAPTVVGSTQAVSVQGQGGAVAVLPGGFDLNSLGLAVPQLTIGNLLGTQAVVRYVAVNTGDADIGDLSLFGFGLHHSISQYMQDPPLDLAVGALYQSFKVGDNLIDATAMTFGAQASRQFWISEGKYLGVEPYGGVSFDSFKMSVEYDSKTADPPVHLDVDFGSSSTARATIGLGVNLLKVIHLQGEANFASQTSYLLGLSLGN